MERDADYFSRRALEEREAAMRAAHPRARRAHVELARLYGELATIEAPVTPLGSKPSNVA